MAIRFSAYTSVAQDQKLEELVAPTLLKEMEDLLDEIVDQVKSEYRQELLDDGWSEGS